MTPQEQVDLFRAQNKALNEMYEIAKFMISYLDVITDYIPSLSDRWEGPTQLDLLKLNSKLTATKDYLSSAETILQDES